MLQELKDTISQLKKWYLNKTELIKFLRLIIDEKSSHEKAFSGTGRLSDQKNSLVPPAKEESSLLEEETVIKEHTRKKKATHEDLFKGRKK